MTAAFDIAAAVAVLSTLLVITRKSAVHALLYLIVSFFAVAVTFVILGAPLVAALEVIVYAGAIMVLFVFVMMLLNLGRASEQQERAWMRPSTWIGPAILSVILFIEIVIVSLRGRASEVQLRGITPKEVSISMFSTYLLGVEMASMLLLAALIGAYYLGRHTVNERSVPTEEEGRIRNDVV